MHSVIENTSLTNGQIEVANRLFFRLYQCANMLHKTGSRAIEEEDLTTQQWAVLGPYDFVNIVEAPDEKVIARVSVELAARGTAHFQTLTAIPVDEFLSLLK